MIQSPNNREAQNDCDSQSNRKLQNSRDSQRNCDFQRNCDAQGYHNFRTHTIAYAALLTALALIFSYVEAMFPLNLGIPGVKLGIANLVVIVALYMLNVKYAFLINIIRIVIAGLLFSGVFGIIYSLAGGLLSLLVMVLLKKSGIFSIVGVSIAGGVAHNLGQLLTAAVLISNIKVFVYFPVLLFAGIICGTVIGIIAFLIIRKL